MHKRVEIWDGGAEDIGPDHHRIKSLPASYPSIENRSTLPQLEKVLEGGLEAWNLGVET